MAILWEKWFKWSLSMLYLAGWVALSLAIPGGFGPWLVGIHLLYATWLYLTMDTSYGQASDIRPLTAWDVPDYDAFRARLKNACEQAGLRHEPVWAVLEEPELNAFAVGGRRGIVILTTGLLQNLPSDELLAIIGHELCHLRSHDALPAVVGGAWLFLVGRFSAWCQEAGRALYGFAAFPFLALSLAVDVACWLLGWVASVVLAKRSRGAEHLADAAGAALTSVDTMCAALERLEQNRRAEWVRPEAKRWSPEWLTERLHASHPPTAQRVSYLRSVQGEV